jgi:class 3 adenylate cyclase
MAPVPNPTRRFATVLFLDIVGSTLIADELGDEGWRSLLARFRSLVRAQLKRHGGREVDTAGDGFFVTFAEPMTALRAARAIADVVQEVGLDVRIGLHAGDVEMSGKHVSGITVHIGARVMSLAGPAQILVTSTVRDMERGADVAFAETHERELKGVEGTWRLFSVTEVQAERPPVPLDPPNGAERRRAAATQPSRRRARLAVASAVCLLLVGTGLVLARPHDAPEPTTPMQAVLVKVDLVSQTTVGGVDAPTTDPNPVAPPVNLGGDLVRVTNRVEFRDFSSGAIQSSFAVPGWFNVSVGVGAVWLASQTGSGAFSEAEWLLFDTRTGEKTDQVPVPDGVYSALQFGPGGGWFITSVGGLAKIDPNSHQLKIWTVPVNAPQVVVPYPRGVWLLDPENRELVWFDRRTHQTHLLPLEGDQQLLVDGETPFSLQRVSIFDPGNGGTITPLGEGVKDPSKAFGIVGDIPSQLLKTSADIESSVFFGSVVDGTFWLAAYTRQPGSNESALVGIAEDESTLTVVVEMPEGFEANWILSDASGESVWIGSCYCLIPSLGSQPRFHAPV